MEKESSSSSDSENAIENDLEVTDEAEKCTDLRRKRKFHFSKNDTNKKKLKPILLSSSGRSSFIRRLDLADRRYCGCSADIRLPRQQTDQVLAIQ